MFAVDRKESLSEVEDIYSISASLEQQRTVQK